MEHTVTIYSTPTCHYCHMAKEFFKENNIEYKEKDVATDEVARKEMLDKTGQLGVPVIQIDDKPPVIGFDRGVVSDLLGL